jgi:tetratricopeptide (TPR) repeat protein
MEKDAAAGASSGRATAGFVAMRAAYVVETRRWKGDAADLKVPSDGMHRDLDLFVTGLAAIETGDRAGAEKSLAAMSSAGGAAAAPSAAHMHGAAASSDASGRASADTVLRQLLDAQILFSKGQRDRALAAAKSAAAAEDGLNYEFGPPDVVKPAHELLGEMLFAAGKAGDAREEFEAALARYPGRALSLLGLARAASKAGDAAAARDAYGKLAAVWSRADADVPELAEVRREAAVKVAGRP